MPKRPYQTTSLVDQKEILLKVEAMLARNVKWTQIARELGIDRQKLQRWHKKKDEKIEYVSLNPETVATVSVVNQVE